MRDEELGYSLLVLHNPKVGNKATRVVPFLSTCSFLAVTQVCESMQRGMNCLGSCMVVARWTMAWTRPTNWP